jgi:O-antigen ligase
MAKANAVLGVGAGNYPTSAVHYLVEPGAAIERDDLILDEPKVAHNLYLNLWAELGFAGLALFIAIIGYALVCGVRAAAAFQRVGNRGMELLTRSVVIAVIGMMTASMFVSLEYDKTIFIMLALCPCLLELSRRRDAARA